MTPAQIQNIIASMNMSPSDHEIFGTSYSIDPTTIQFAEVPCLLDDCAARYCRQLKAPIPIARKSCKKGTASCAECEAAYCRIIEGRN